MNFEQINERIAAIREALNGADADLDALETELNELLAQRTAILNNAERRRRLLASIASDPTPGHPVIPAEPNGGEDTPVYATPEYRTAFLRMMSGRTLNEQQRSMMNAEIERRALSSDSASAGVTIPTIIHDEVLRRLAQVAPLIDEINLMHVPGNLSILVESATTSEGSDHEENTEIEDAEDKPIDVVLGGYEVVKIISISAKLSAMSVDAFERWLTDMLVDGLSYKIERRIVNGTGTNQAKGIAKARTWTHGTSAIKFAGAKPTYDEVCGMIALLPGVYCRRAKFVMNHSTLWKNVMPIRDDSRAPICKEDGKGGYVILGIPCLESDMVADGEIYLGDLKQYYGNFAQDIGVDSSKHSSFRKNKTDYRAACLFDGKPAIPEAFVKGGATI